MESGEGRNEGVVFPTPTFDDHFRTYFAHPGRKENSKSNLIFYSTFLKAVGKKRMRWVRVNGADLFTLTLMDAHEELKPGLGKDIILYPDIDLSKCPQLRILRADYTERQDKVCAMLWAAFCGDFESVKKLISIGSYVDRQMPNGNTPLMEAVAGHSSCRCQCVRLLLEAGARINIENEHGHTVFLAAAWAGDMEVLRLICKMRTVNINHKTKRGSTALTLAVIRQHHEVVRFLVSECGASPLLEDSRCMTPVCWSQVTSPSVTGYLCLHLGLKNMLDPFVMRRVEVLKALVLLCARDADDPDVFEMPQDETELLALIYNLTNILLLLKPSRRMLVSKGVLNLVSKSEMWEDLLPEEDHDGIGVGILQILPWFVALGCGMLYNETYILEGFIKTGAADRFVDTMNQSLPVSDGIRGRLSIQAMFSPVMAFKQGRQWLCKTGFKYKHVLEHFVDAENVLEERGTEICKAFVQLMDANFGHYKLKANYKFFGEANVKKFCPDPPMTVREKLQETLAYFEEIKQRAKDAQADLNMQEFVDADWRESLMRQEHQFKSKLRKLKKKEQRKMRRLKEEVQASKEEMNEKPQSMQEENGNKTTPQKAKHAQHQQHRLTFEEYLLNNQERPIALRSAEDMYCSKTSDKTNEDVSREKMILSYLIESAGGQWEKTQKRKRSKKAQKLKSENGAEKSVQAERENTIALTEKSQEKVVKPKINQPKNTRYAKPNMERQNQEKPQGRPIRLMGIKLNEEPKHMVVESHNPSASPPATYSAACTGQHKMKAPTPPPSPLRDVLVQGEAQPAISPSVIPGALLLSQVEDNILKLKDTDVESQLIFGFFGSDDNLISTIQNENNQPTPTIQIKSNPNPTILTDSNPTPIIQASSAGSLPSQVLVETTATKPKSEPSSPTNQDPQVSFHANPSQVTPEAAPGLIEAGAAGDQAPKAAPAPQLLPKMTWVPRSLRWRPLFERLMSTPPEKRQKVGSIHLSFYDEALIIAAGSNGTLVSIGLRDDGMEVAVKRLPKCNSRFIKNELENLRIPEIEHENIVKYRDYVEDENFGYLALELCECTLEDYVHELRHTGKLQERARRLVWQLLRGLAVLHRAKILHMDLKPRNVLVDVRGNVRLADFGLSRRMDEAHSTAYHAALQGGTRCWRPREALLNAGPGNHPEPYKTVSDVQVAGMVIYYVMSGGQHPYGQTQAEIEEAIVSGVPRLSEVTDETLVNLMSWMLHPDVGRRKSAEECLTHPFFWQESKRFAFLYKVSQEAEFQLHAGQTSIVRQVVDSMGTWLKMADWRTEVDPYVMSPHMSLLNYSSSMSDLLRFMADVENDFNKLNPDLRRMLGDPGYYFLIKFPRVFMVVYEIIRESDLRHRRSLTDFFDIHNYVENNSCMLS